MVWMVLTLALMFILQLLTISLAIMVWIFLSNRCADHVEAAVQFQVDLADLSDSEDDFDVTGDDSPDRKRSRRGLRHAFGALSGPSGKADKPGWRPKHDSEVE